MGRKLTKLDIETCHRIRALRTALFDSQAAACDHFGINRNTWNQWEKYKQKCDLNEALKLKRKGGITLDWIYAGDADGLPLRLARQLQYALDRIGEPPFHMLSTEPNTPEGRTIR